MRAEWLENLPLGEAFHNGFAETPGAEKSGVAWAKDGADTEFFGDGAGVLATGTAEGDERVVAGIVAFADGDFANRVGHPFVGDVEKTGEQILLRRRFGNRLTNLFKRGLGGVDVDRDAELGGIEPAEQQVNVGDRQRATRAVAGRAGIRARALRADKQLVAVEAADRAATGGDRLDGEHRRDHPGAADAMLVFVIEVTVEPADVGARAAHVEPDDALEAGLASGHRGTDDTTGRAAEQAVLGPVIGAGDESTRAGHHVQFAAGQLALHAFEIARHNRREVGVDDGRLGARQDFDDRRQVAGHGDVLPTGVAEVLGQALFVFGVTVAVQTDDGGGLVFVFRRISGGKVERAEYLAKGVESFVDANDVGGERCRFLDVQSEKVRAFLVADDEQILEAARDEQRDVSAFFLEQRVRGASGGQVHDHRWERLASRSTGGDSGRENRGLDVEGDLDRLAMRRAAGQRLGQAELAWRVVTDDFDRLAGLAKEPELLTKREAGDERLGQCNCDFSRRVDGQERAPKATAGENLEAMGALVWVGCEAVGEGAAGVHPDAPAAFLSIGCVVTHDWRIAAQ